jgi:hypothetical protein
MWSRTKVLNFTEDAHAKSMSAFTPMSIFRLRPVVVL